MSILRSRMLYGLLVLAAVALPCRSQRVDSDHDGFDDGLEQRLLEQFQPEFQVGVQDCANVPASFEPGARVPTPRSEDGTIYGQVFPSHGDDPEHPRAEVHYYHLWSRDCGAHGHPLDTEHVAVLLRASGSDLDTATWKAEYWYAAAHENTVCDVSQITKASSLHAEEHGANVWISPDKHASYFDVALCSHGCGADRCSVMRKLARGKIINLGEEHAPMNGSVFVSSPQWPLAAKMRQTNFDAQALSRASKLADNQIALYNPGRHPMQGVIAISASTEDAIAQSGGNTTDALGTAGDKTSGALATAGDKTSGALATAGDKTGDALGKSYQSTKHALGTSARHVGRALGLGRKAEQRPQPQ